MQITVPTTIWLDCNSDNSSNSFLLKLKECENVQTFIEVDPCLDYIKCHTEQSIFLIISGAFALQTVPQIYEYPNILMIFVFCASMKTYTDWALDFCEKLLMFDHEDDLLQRFWLRFEEYSREQAKEYTQLADVCKERARQLKQSCG